MTAKEKARSMVTLAIKDGTLRRPNGCSKCTRVCVPHGHHTDYSKPLDVVWLCAVCHRAAHSMRRDPHQRLLTESERASETLYVRMDASTRNRVDTPAKANGCALTAMARILIEEALEAREARAAA